MKKKDNYIILIIIILILISTLGLLYLNKNNKVNNKTPNYVLLNDYSRFFTINSCLYKYISYVSNGDSDSILKILDNDYVKDNNINSNNIYNFITKLDGNYSFKAMKIVYDKDDKDYVTYYVYGYLMEEIIDELPKKEEKYYKVVLDLNNQTFSVTPYDGEIFKEVAYE